MSKKDRKRFSREFKLEAVRLSHESGKPITEVARDLDIGVHHLYRWRDQSDNDGAKVFPGAGNKATNGSELERLKRENSRLRQERDILALLARFRQYMSQNDSERRYSSLKRSFNTEWRRGKIKRGQCRFDRHQTWSGKNKFRKNSFCFITASNYFR